MKTLGRWFDVAMVVAGIIFLTVEVWRDRSNDYKVIMDHVSEPFPPDDEDAGWEEFAVALPLFSTRPAIRMVN
jgi:hypothetical protein